MYNTKWFTTLLALIFLFFWSSGAVFVKLGLPYAGPFTFLTLRHIFAAALLFLICFATKAPWPKERRLFMHIVIAGSMLQTMYVIGSFYSLSLNTSPSLFAMVLGAQPLLTAVVCHFTFEEEITWKQWAGLILGFIGLFLVTANGLSGHDLSWQSLAAMLMALAGITFGTIYQKRHCQQADPRALCAIQNALNIIPVLLLGWFFESLKVQWTLTFIIALFWVSVLVSVVALVILFILIKRGSVTKVSSLFYLMPIFTAFMDYLIFGNKLDSVEITSLFIITIAIFLVNHPRKKCEEPI